MKISALDLYTVDYGDIDLSPLSAVGDLKVFDISQKDSFYDEIGESDAIVVNKIMIDAKVLDHCPRLKYIGILATGYNNVDTRLCKERGITVCNVPGYSTEAVCQHVFALLLAFESRIPQYAESVAIGDWQACPTFCYNTWPTTEICGKTMGVVGYGAIGKRVSAVASALGLNVIVCTRSHNSPYENVTMDELLRRSDYVTLHCPLTSETANMINKDSLALMKPGAVLINTGRGGLIDEHAVADALGAGRLRGFLADVLTHEPPSAGSPLIGAENSLITPHIAWAPKETRQRLIQIVAANLVAFRDGRPQNVVC